MWMLSPRAALDEEPREGAPAAEAATGAARAANENLTQVADIC